MSLDAGGQFREPRSAPAAPQEVYERLQALGIAFKRFEHPPVATAADAARYWADLPATPCKNLFLRNQKGSRHYLVIMRLAIRADLRAIADQIGDGKLSFGTPNRLMELLGVTPGSVSPFGLIHDRERQVRVAVDEALNHAGSLLLHPNINSVTLAISVADFERFLHASGNTLQYISPV